jgi:hypothetical protein
MEETFFRDPSKVRGCHKHIHTYTRILQKEVGITDINMVIKSYH